MFGHQCRLYSRCFPILPKNALHWADTEPAGRECTMQLVWSALCNMSGVHHATRKPAPEAAGHHLSLQRTSSLGTLEPQGYSLSCHAYHMSINKCPQHAHPPRMHAQRMRQPVNRCFKENTRLIHVRNIVSKAVCSICSDPLSLPKLRSSHAHLSSTTCGNSQACSVNWVSKAVC
jgi:hypothetical protein